MLSLLDVIFDTMYSSGNIAQLTGAFLWGIASVLLSPCGIATVPLVVGCVENTDSPTRMEAFKISCAFCLGLVLNFMLVAFITSSIGMLLGGYERILTLIVATVFIVMGAHLMGIIHVRFFSFRSGRNANVPIQHKLRASVVLGIVSGLAVGPCSIAYVTPVLSLAMSRAAESFMMSIGLVIAYALGYSTVLILSGTFAQLASAWLQSDRGNTVLRVVNNICGAVLIAVGIYLIWGLIVLM